MMKAVMIISLLVTGCAAVNHPKPDVNQKVAWLPCEVEVVTFHDNSKTVAKVVKTQWECENKN